MRVLRALALTLALAAAILPAGFAAAQISLLGLRNSLVQFALARISTPERLEITAEGVREAEDGRAELQGVRVADRLGVWLEVDAMRLSWSPARILRGELQIDELSARGVRVLRRPVGEDVAVEVVAEAPPRPAFSWPRAPIATRVTEARLDGVFVAEGVLGPQSIAFDALGAARDEGNEQAARLTLTRTDAIEGRIAFDYLRDFAAGTLRATLDASEAAGGLVAELAGFPPDSASRLSLNADGPLTDWTLSFEAEAEQVFEAEGAADVNLTAPVAVAADFVARPGPALGPAARAALAPEARLIVRAAEDADGVIRVSEAAIRSPELTLDLTGAFTRSTGAIASDLRLEAGSGLGDLTDGLAFARAGFEGRIAGTLSDFTAAGALSLDGLATAPVDIGAARLDATVAVAGSRVDLVADGAAEGLRLDRLGPDILGRVALDLDGAFENGVATLDRLALDSGLLDAEASGRADLTANAAALAYRVSAPDLAPVAAAYDVDARGAFSASGRLEGPLDAPRLAGEAGLAEITLAEEPLGGVRLTHDATLGATPQGRVALTADGSRFGPARVGTDFRLAQGVLTLTALDADALGATARGAVSYDIPAALATGAVELSVADLGEAAGRAALSLSGAVDGRVVLLPENGAQSLRLDLDGDRLRGFDAAVERLRVDATVRDLTGAPAIDGVIEARGLDHPAARLGSARFEGRAEGIGAALSAAGTLTAEDLAAAGWSVARLGFEGEGTDLTGAGAARGTLEASGVAGPDGAAVGALRFEGSARDFSGALAADGVLTARDAAFGPARVAALRLDGAGADLTGSPSATGVLTAEGVEAAGARIATLRAEGEAADLTGAPTAALALTLGAVEAAGFAGPGARLDARLTQPRGGARLDASAAVEPLTSAEGRLGAATLEAVVENAFAPERRVDAAVTLGPSEIAGATVSGATVTARGPAAALDLTASADGETRDGEPATLDAAARLDIRDTAAITGRVDRLSAAYGDARAELRAPARLRLGDVTALDGLDLALPGGGLSGDLALYGNGAAGDLALSLSDVGPLARLAELPLFSGALAAEARFDTRPGRARADATATGRDLVPEFSAGRDLGGLDLDATATWNGSRAEAQATLAGPFDQPLAASVAVGLRPSGGPLPALVPGAPLDGRIRWAGRLGDLWAQVPAPDHILDGDAAIDLTLSGPARAPDVSGSVTLRDGRYEFLETGTILTDLRIDSRVAPGGAFELDLAADDGAGGPVTGLARFADGALDLRLTAREAVLVRRDDVTAAVSAEVRVAGPLADLAVTGAVDIDRAEVRLVDATPPSVATLGDVRIKGAPPPEADAGGASRVSLDLRIRADDRIFVRGRGLDSEWRADVAVGGTADAPVVTGSIDKIRGVLSLIGAVFELERGTVRFTGGQPIDPVLDVALFRENRGVRGGVVVDGPASDPRISFQSQPPLPESEVLPRVLFGTTRQSLTPGQAVQLALGLATLLDGTGGAIDAARATIGIDVLRFEEEQLFGDDGEETTRQTVTVGTNVADGVFVGAVQPIDGGTARVRVEIEVFDNVTVDTEIGAEDRNSVGVNWRMDF